MAGIITASAIGLAGAAYSAHEAGKSADKARDASAAASAAELAFAKQQYADWRGTYGALEKNISQYYNSVSPEYYEAQGLQAFQDEQQAARDSMEVMFAQRGLSGSGLAERAFIDQDISGAETRAGIRMNAPRAAMQEKQSFLSLGMGNDPSGDVQNVLGNSADRAFKQQMSAEGAEGAAYGALPSALSSGVQAVADYKRYKTPETEKTGITDYNWDKY